MDGSTPAKLPFGDDARQVSVARKGKRLAFVKVNPLNADIWRADGSAVVQQAAPVKLISSTRIDWAPDYSPDGSRIAFVSQRNGANAVWVCDSEGTSCQQLTHEGRATPPSWSPDGRSIVFSWILDGNPDVYAIDTGDAFPRRLTDEDSQDAYPEWSRDGRWIYFSSDRSGLLEVWKVRRDGGEAMQVTTEGGGGPAVESEDSSYLFIGRPRENWTIIDIVKHDLATGEETVILEGETGGYNWDLREGGRSIIYGSPLGLGQGSFTIKSLDLKSGRKELIAELEIDGRIGNGLSVSPDGRSILYSVMTPQTTDIMVVEGFH